MSHDVITSGSTAYQVDDATKEIVRPDGQRVRVRPRSFALLRFLHTNKGRPFTSNEILALVWGKNYAHNNFCVAISELRRRAGADVVDHDSPYYGVGIT